MNFRKTENLVAAATVFLAMAMTSCVAPVIDSLRGDGTARGIDIDTPSALTYEGVDASSDNCQYVWGPWESTGNPGEYERSHITLREESGSGDGCPSGPQTEALPEAPLATYEFGCADAYADGDFDGCAGIYPGSSEIKDIVATGPLVPMVIQQAAAVDSTVHFTDARLFPLTQNIDDRTAMIRPASTESRADIIASLFSEPTYERDVGGIYLNTQALYFFNQERTRINNLGIVLVSKLPTVEKDVVETDPTIMSIPSTNVVVRSLRFNLETITNSYRAIVYVGKINQDGSLDGSGMTQGCTGLGIDFVRNSCILVYNSVYELDDMGDRDGAADDWAENRLLVVAAAISQIARVFGLTAREAAQVMFAAADKSCTTPACGQGKLDLTKLFDPETGQVKLVLDMDSDTSVSTSSQQGERSLSYSPGSVSLPGLQDEVAVMGFNQYVDKPFNLVRSSESVEASFEPSDTDLRTFGTRTGFGFAMSSEAFGYCRNGVCPYVSVKGEAGVKRFASDDLAYFVSYRRTDDFFGGEGTGSLGFGQTDNLAAGIKYTRELDGNLALSLGADLVHGRAGDGELIGDLRGTLFRPGLELRREEPLTSGARRVMSLGLRQNNFTGGFRVPGATHKLRERDWEASLSFEFQH